MSDEPGYIPPEEYQKAVDESRNARRVLRLYVAGNTPSSARSIARIREVCETYLEGNYVLEVIDIHQQPKLASEAQIIATPTLIKSLPLPLRRVIGDLSRTEQILIGLDIVGLE